MRSKTPTLIFAVVLLLIILIVAFRAAPQTDTTAVAKPGLTAP